MMSRGLAETTLVTTLVMLLALASRAGGQTPPAAEAPNATTAGELVIDPPTLICLGFMWNIAGDANVDAAVKVEYRKAGAAAWKDYLPLYRTGRGRTANYGFGRSGAAGDKPMQYVIPDGFAGSIMDLEPDTAYEVRLTMSDPDGVSGEAVRQVTVRTRPEPTPMAGGEVRHVYPPGYKGKKEEPAYENIMHAVNGFNPWCDCYQTVSPYRAKPGTTIKLHGGLYKYQYDDYRNGPLWQHGTYTLIADGEEGKPIAIVAAGDGEVIIDGGGCDNLFNIMAADYLYFEGLTIRNTRIAFHGGFQGVMGCKGLTVKRCKIENVGYGVLAQDGRSSDFYIADNIIIGKNAPEQLHPTAGGAWGRSAAGYAVNLAGTGHVVCYNYCAQFWDTINVFTNSLADPELKQQSLAIDFYNNDIHNTCDNFIETDGSFRNIRVMRNRCFNCIATPLSWQPVYQGPVYWIRNVVYNAAKGTQAFKASGGDNIIGYHNTFSGHWSAYAGTGYGDFRNNLFAGPAKAFGREGKRVSYLNTGMDDPRSIFDYNAYRAPDSFDGAFQLQVGKEKCQGATLAELAAKCGAEKHGVTFKDYSIFANAAEPNHAQDKTALYYGPDVDLRPKADAPVVDAGCVIVGVNESFGGRAPDIGAYEAGQPMPVYGPRDPELQKAVTQRIADIKAGKIKYEAPAASGEQGGQPAATAAPAAPAGPVVGKAIDGIVGVDKDGTIEGIIVGGVTIKADALMVGKVSTDSEYDPAPAGDLKLVTGIPGNSRTVWNLDVTGFGGKDYSRPTAAGADFFIFEAGGNDPMTISAILADGAVGKPVVLNPQSWTKLDLTVGFAAGSVCGMAVDVTDLLDANGQPLKRDVVVKGIRLTGTGMDPLCVCAVR